MTWQTTWQSRWTIQTPSQCRSRVSHQQNVGRTCTSCLTSTPSSQIPLASWRKTPQRTAFQVGISFQQSVSQSVSQSFIFVLSLHPFSASLSLYLPYLLSHIICTQSCLFLFLSGSIFFFFLAVLYMHSALSPFHKLCSYILHSLLTICLHPSSFFVYLLLLIYFFLLLLIYYTNIIFL